MKRQDFHWNGHRVTTVLLAGHSWRRCLRTLMSPSQAHSMLRGRKTSPPTALYAMGCVAAQQSSFGRVEVLQHSRSHLCHAWLAGIPMSRWTLEGLPSSSLARNKDPQANFREGRWVGQVAFSDTNRDYYGCRKVQSAPWGWRAALHPPLPASHMCRASL